MNIKNNNEKFEEKTSDDSLVYPLCGYHSCFLSEPPHLEYVSENLVQLLGYNQDELEDLAGSAYTALIHPEDTGTFDAFCSCVAEKESSRISTYRMIKKDGSEIRVVDTMTSSIGDDGTMRGASVVCELANKTNLSRRDKKFATLCVSVNDGMPINTASGLTDKLLALKGDSKNLNFLDFISINDRNKLIEAFHASFENKYSGRQCMTVVPSNGNGIACDLWIERKVKGDTFEESQFIVKIEVDDGYKRDEKSKIHFSETVFSNLVDDLFEVNKIDETVKYICVKENRNLGILPNVRFNCADFLSWFLKQVTKKDRNKIHSALDKINSWTIDSSEAYKPIKIKCEMTDSSRFAKNVVILFFPLSLTKYFVCVNSDVNATGLELYKYAEAEEKNISVRMFGSFSLTVNGEAVHIRSEKGRELLALLIEKRGAFLTTREAISALWECEPNDTTRARYRKIASRLNSELKKIGIDYIIESERGARRIIPEFIKCDYYDFRDGKIEPTDVFLPEYTWSEFVRID